MFQQLVTFQKQSNYSNRLGLAFSTSLVNSTIYTKRNITLKNKKVSYNKHYQIDEVKNDIHHTMKTIVKQELRKTRKLKYLESIFHKAHLTKEYSTKARTNFLIKHKQLSEYSLSFYQPIRYINMQKFSKMKGLNKYLPTAQNYFLHWKYKLTLIKEITPSVFKKSYNTSKRTPMHNPTSTRRRYNLYLKRNTTNHLPQHHLAQLERLEIIIMTPKSLLIIALSQNFTMTKINLLKSILNLMI